MQSPKTKRLTVALAAIMVLGALDAASARQKKKYRAAKPAVSKVDRVPGTLVPLDVDGTPIIMQGYSSPRMMRDGTAQPAERAHRPVKIRAAAARTFRRPIHRPMPATARRPRR